MWRLSSSLSFFLSLSLCFFFSFFSCRERFACRASSEDEDSSEAIVHVCATLLFTLDLLAGYLLGTRFRFRSVASVRARYRLRKSPTRTRKTGYAHRTHHTTDHGRELDHAVLVLLAAGGLEVERDIDRARTFSSDGRPNCVTRVRGTFSSDGRPTCVTRVRGTGGTVGFPEDVLVWFGTGPPSPATATAFSSAALRPRRMAK